MIFTVASIYIGNQWSMVTLHSDKLPGMITPHDISLYLSRAEAERYVIGQTFTIDLSPLELSRLGARP